MSTVIVRADSSSEIGTGHIMRDLLLAKREFADRRVLFAVRDLPGNINRKIEEAGYEVRLLGTLSTEELAELVRKEEADTVVIDHYGIGEEQERLLKEATGVSIFVLDDTYERHRCDTLLNPNPYAEPQRYAGRVPEGTCIRCGVSEMLVRDEFRRLRWRGSEEGGKVFVAMGGNDASALSLPVLRCLEKCDGVRTIDLVTVSANPRLAEIRDFLRSRRHVRLHVDTERMAELMQRADLAVVTPSGVLNEVMTVGTPFVALQSATNQREMVRWLSERGYPILKTFRCEELCRLTKEKLWKRN